MHTGSTVADRITLDMACVASADHFVEVNERWTKVLGWPREQLLTRPFADFLHPDDVQPTADAVRSLQAGEPIVGFENRYRRADGTWASLLWSAVYDPASGLIHGRSSDISRERAAIAQRDRLLFVTDVQAELQARFLASGVDPGWWSLSLERIVMLTESAFGFIGTVENDPNGDPILRSLAITHQADDPWFASALGPTGVPDLVFRNMDSLFGVTVTTGEIVISDNPSADPRRCGLPNGHPALDSYAGLPLRDGPALVGMVGLANRPGGFTPDVVEDLAPLLLFISQIIGRDLAARRANKTAREAERLGAQVSGLTQAATHADLLREAYATIIAAPDPTAAAHAAVAAMMGLDSAASMGVFMATTHPDTLLCTAGDPGSGGPHMITRTACEALRTGRVHITTPGDSGPACDHAGPHGFTVCAPIPQGLAAPGLLVVRAPASADRGAGDHGEADFLAAAAEQLASALGEAMVRSDLARIARTDHLTGLDNRLAFLQALEAALSSAHGGARPIGLILADIDDFKRVNDALGHDAGDAVLRAAADMLRGAVREGDVLARLGGDEFIVMMAPTDTAALQAAADRILQGARGVMAPDGAALSVSVGALTLGTGHVSWHDAYQAVDSALYRAKGQGKDRVVIGPPLGDAVSGGMARNLPGGYD